MVIGMAMQKITITVSGETLAAIRQLVAEGRAANVSSFVRHAIGVSLDDAAGWHKTLEEMLSETGGPMSDAEREWADSVILGAGDSAA